MTPSEEYNTPGCTTLTGKQKTRISQGGNYAYRYRSPCDDPGCKRPANPGLGQKSGCGSLFQPWQPGPPGLSQLRRFDYTHGRRGCYTTYSLDDHCPACSFAQRGYTRKAGRQSRRTLRWSLHPWGGCRWQRGRLSSRSRFIP